MFAPLIAKQKTKSAEFSRAPVASQRHGQPALSQVQLLQRRIGNQALLRLFAQHGNEPGAAGNMARLPGILQAKLRIGAVNDPLEHEADRVADQVMRMPAPDLALSSAPQQVSRKCEECEEEEEKLQMKEAGPEAAAGHAPASVHEVLRSPGQPLDAATRGFMEPRFGQDFSGVRVHTGTSAEQSARDVNANAYTVGHDVVFDAGRFAPGALEGRRLIAHELTHVVQQSGADGIRTGQGNEKRGLSPIVRYMPGTRQERALLAHELTHVLQQGGSNPAVGAPVALQRQSTASPASTGRAPYPTTGERRDIQEILNPVATEGVAPPVTDPDGFKAAMQARMNPYIDMVVAAARERESSSVSLSQGVIESLGDVAQPAVESFYGSYLRAAVHTPDETTRRAGFRLREHLHLVPNTPQPNTDEIAKEWVLSRMEQQGADLLSHFNVISGEGRRDQTLFLDVGDAIFEDRKDDIRTIVLFYPGFESAGEASIQAKVAPLDEDEPETETKRRGRWGALEATIHEMLHAVTHERFEEVVEPLERSGIAVEGFTEYFTRPVYDSLAERAVKDNALRASIEGVAAPYKSLLVPASEADGYQQYVDAVHEIRSILGGSDEGLKLAYFQGLVEYIGLGGWNEAEAERRRFPGNTLGFGALLTFDDDDVGLLRLDYARVVMGRAGALQLRLGGQVYYLEEGHRLGVAGTVSLRIQGTKAYIEGQLGVGGSASAEGAPVSDTDTDTVRLDLIPGMEAGVRIGAYRVGVNAMLLFPIKGGPVSERVLRLGLGIGLGLDF